MAPLKYPIGIQTFEEIITDGWAYADKTAYVYQLATTSKQVFLSRPRRFGKSLLLSTFESYFEGKKELFEGLALGKLETEWNSYPVLHFSFGSIQPEDASVICNSINIMLRQFEKQFEVEIHDDVESFGTRFGILVQNIARKTGKKVVVLVDEYDKGIVDLLHDKEKLEKNVSLFRPFYAQLKDQDKYLRFVFLAGVSRFRNLTLFFSPNQLEDISMDARYASICGLTTEELHTVFAEGIKDLAQSEGISVEEAKRLLKLKYDGYRFTREDDLMYNPFSILKCLKQRTFDNFWLISGGSSKIFIDYLKKSNYNLDDIEQMWVNAETLGGPYSTEDPIPLLFQTGYLTIADYKRNRYRLKIPNGEVRSALVDQLVPLYLGIDKSKTRDLLYEIWNMTEEGDAEGLLTLIQQIISKIPHQTFRNEDTERIYHLTMSLICQMAGINAKSEVSVAGGDIDMLIKTRDYVYVIEFKKDHTPAEAMEQIDSKAYALSWRADGRKVFKIGVEFSSANRNITDWIIKSDF